MKLQWDRNYLKYVLYAALTFTVCYVNKLLLDAASHLLIRFDDVMDAIGKFFSGVMRVFSPLVIGLILAYILDPLVDYLQKRFDTFNTKCVRPVANKCRLDKLNRKKVYSSYKPRTAGTALAYILILALLLLLSITIFRKITSMEGIAESIASIVNSFSDKYAAFQISMSDWGILDFVSGYLSEFINSIAVFVQNMGDKLITAVTSAGGGILNFFLGVVIAFYFSKDKERLLSKAGEAADLLLPDKFNRILRNALGDIHTVFSGYVRGQLTDAVIMAVLIGGFLTLIRVDFAIIIGVLSGFSNIIPYFGAVTGFVLSVAVALISGSPVKALYAAIGIIILQQIDGIFIVPKVVGKNVELSPVLVLLSITIAGNIFGFAGLLLAVPVCAVVKIFFERFMERRKAAVTAEEHV